MRTPRGDTKTNPKLALSFTNDPSKYIVQYFSSTAARGI
jgi:hypothetical protein